MRKLAFVIVIAAATPSSAVADMKQPFSATFNAGRETCGAWSAAQNLNDHLKSITHRYWLYGYLAGYNAFGPGSPSDVTDRTDADGVILWMNNFCITHPFATLDVAAKRLIVELRRP